MLDGAPLQSKSSKHYKPNQSNAEKRFHFHGEIIGDAIVFPCEEEMVCQQKAEQLFRQTQSEQMMMRESSVFMKHHSCREASCRRVHLNQMAPERKGEKKSGTSPRTQHQLAISTRTSLNKGFLAIHCTMAIHITVVCYLLRRGTETKRKKGRIY